MQTNQLLKNDLCSNCMFHNSCSHLSNEAVAIRVCEEHVSEAGIPVANHTNKKDVILDTNLGLCLNCDHLTNCMLPEKGMKITQCEEYK